MSHIETLRPAFAGHEKPLISYGLHFANACRKHVQTTFKASRVYIIVSKSLINNTGALKDLQQALGSLVVGIRLGMKPHTLWSEVLEIVHDARIVNADILITLGGSSLTDAAKVVAFALANDVQDNSDLAKLPNVFDTPQLEDAKAPTIPIISVPTTLSGGEYSNYGGATEDETHIKYQFKAPLRGPAIIVLDANLAITVPDRLWLASGFRSIDHCVETLCSLQSDAEADRWAAEGLKQLVPGLLGSKGKDSVEARQKCQLGVPHSLFHFTRGVRLGASHGIGHMLGPMGVGHGETSCILSPAVCKYNAKHNANVERQAAVLEIIWADPTASMALTGRGLEKDKADLGDVLDAIVREMNMPRTLKEVGIGRGRLDELAENSLRDMYCESNPVPLRSKQQVLEILDAVAG